MVLVIGEILYDQFPGYRRLGGAPFNYSVNLKNLGLPVRFISRVGSDNYGEEIINSVKVSGLDTSDIQLDLNLPTGMVLIEFDDNCEPSFDIKMDTAYDNFSYEIIRSYVDMDDIELIYVGTLIQRTENGFKNIQKLLNSRNKATSIFYDINLRPRCFSKKIITETLLHSDIVKLNMDELTHLKSLFRITGDIRDVIQNLSKIFNLSIVAVTNGKDEAILFNNHDYYTGIPPLVEDFQDAVGAGDAFGAALTAGLIGNRRLESVLEGALALSSHICSVKGAIPADKSIYDKVNIILSGDE